MTACHLCLNSLLFPEVEGLASTNRCANGETGLIRLARKQGIRPSCMNFNNKICPFSSDLTGQENGLLGGLMESEALVLSRGAVCLLEEIMV